MLRRRRASPGREPYNNQEHDTSDKGDENAAEVYAGGAYVAEIVPNPTAHNRSDNADDQVTQYAAWSLAGHDHFP